MRVLSYLFISLFILSFASCSSDDDNNQEVTILGKWNVSEMTMTSNFIQEGIPISMNAISNSMAGNDITFNENNTFTGNSAPFDIVIKYEIGGVSSTMTQPSGNALPVSGNWRKEGNNLYLKEGGSEEIRYTIETLDATTLKLSGDQNSIDIGEDYPPGTEIRVTVTLKR